MCGIAGVFPFDDSVEIDSDIIKAMCDVIIYRGPDDGGYIGGCGFGMGARRLAILDISVKGHMPMDSENHRYSIVYNGEVYNFKELREDLEEKGISFNTETDTEVVLKSYIYYGSSCLHSFNGMFAFAIYDHSLKKVFIARDRLGVKPLYYSVYKNQLIIGSEIKCLWQADVPKQFDNDKFAELLSFRYVAGQETIYKNVKRLLPGHYIEIDNGILNISKWWAIDDFANKSEFSPIGNPNDWFRNVFDDAITLRKISDVPVGVLLSGGLDSGSVAASMAKTPTSKISSFTVRFKEQKYDEGDLAKEVAEKYDLDFNELYLDVENIFDKTVEVLKYNDEPIYHASDLFVKEISEYAKSKVTVLLSGEGGDETLGGYIRYNPLRYPLLLKLGFAFKFFLTLIPINHHRIKKLIRMLSLRSIDNFILFNSSEILPDDLNRFGFIGKRNFGYREKVVRDAEKCYTNDPLRKVMYYDMHTFLCSVLDRNDQMTMRASIECRVPFLDYRLVQGLAAMPTASLISGKEFKSLLRNSVGDRLPKSVMGAKKWGFAVPWQNYYRNDPKFNVYLSKIYDHYLIKENFSSPQIIKNIVSKFLEGDNSDFGFVNQIVNICLWYDLNFKNENLQIEAATEKKNILYIGNFLAKHKLNANFNVFLIQRLQEKFKVISTSDKKNKFIRMLDMSLTLIKSRKKVDVLIIDVFSSDAFWYAIFLSILCIFFKLPYINILHGGNLPMRLNKNKRLSKILFQHSANNVSPSIFLEKQFIDNGYKVNYIPNFVEIENYKFKERTSTSFNLLWVRSFHKVYNPIMAIRILKSLVDLGYDAKLCMIGPDKDGSGAEVVTEAKNLNVFDRLEITGRLSREEWTKHSEKSDIFINTTNVDNHPVSVIEAMALGLPIVSTNVGGLPYLVNDGFDGILLPKNDVKAFTEAIIKLVNNPELSLSLAKNARNKAEGFNWEFLKEKWNTIINSSIKSR